MQNLLSQRATYLKRIEQKEQRELEKTTKDTNSTSLIDEWKVLLNIDEDETELSGLDEIHKYLVKCIIKDEDNYQEIVDIITANQRLVENTILNDRKFWKFTPNGEVIEEE